MNELVSLVTSQLKVDQNQAEGGLGALMGAAQKFLGEDFSTLSKALPGIGELIAKAPAASQGSGLGGLVGGVMSALGQSDSKLAVLNTVVSQFKSLGLNADSVAQFLPIVTDFLKKSDNGAASALIEKVVAQLKP